MEKHTLHHKTPELQTSPDVNRAVNPLTAVEKKIQDGQPLTREDLILLYEINSPVEDLGNKKDSHIAELRKNRNPEEDMLVIFNCTKDQIAHTSGEINENIKAYVGQLEPGIFQKLSEHLEYLYTSFPEGKIRREQLEIGGKSADQLMGELERVGIPISNEVKSMLKSDEFMPAERPEEATLIFLTVADLGFKYMSNIDKIYKRAEELGLVLCPAEVGPHYRLKYIDQPKGDALYVGMKQIRGLDSGPNIFVLVRQNGRFGRKMIEHVEWAYPNSEWPPELQLVFRLRKSET